MSRPPKFTVGRMRYWINVQSHTDTVDDAGQPVSTWANLHTNVPAEYEATSGGQRFRGSQVSEGIDAIFTIRHISDIDETQRIVFRGQSYGIVFIKPVAGRDRYDYVYTKAVKS